MNSSVLRDEQEDDEEGASRAPSSQGGDAQALNDSGFIEVCKHAMAKLGLQWPASLGALGTKRDLLYVKVRHSLRTFHCQGFKHHIPPHCLPSEAVRRDGTVAC